MSKTILNYILIYIARVIAQVVLFNNLVLFHSAIALVFLYLLVELPQALTPNRLMTIGFALGLTIDIFQDTPGLNALTCTLVAALRPKIFHLYVPHDEDYGTRRLTARTLGTSTYLKYMMTMVLIYCVIYFCVEALNYADVNRLALRIVASTAFTFIVLFALDSLTIKKNEKRL